MTKEDYNNPEASTANRDGFEQKFAALINYDGTNFCGWQRQDAPSGDLPSIQQTLETCLHQMTDQRPAWVASGRTDSGVHAIGQVAHFRLKDDEHKPRWSAYKILRGMNTLLPPSIRILKVTKVPHRFHAQIGAVKKQYAYYFLQGSAPLAHLSRFTRYTHHLLNVEIMNEALQKIVGTHDFKALQGAGTELASTVRTITEASVEESQDFFPHFSPGPDYRLIRIRVQGTGFLKHMVRSIAGSLFEIGKANRPMDSLFEAVKTQNRKLVGPTAPAQGLWLEKVWYDFEPFQEQNKTL